jgi:cysteine desulfurase/selenocysteine lyase
MPGLRLHPAGAPGTTGSRARSSGGPVASAGAGVAATSVPGLPSGTDPFDARAVRAEFPIFATPREKPLIYLDSAATSQKPQAVLDAMQRYYETCNANIHRGVYRIAEEATALYEDARRRVAAFLGAGPREVVFTRNATEALNLVARCHGGSALSEGDAILLTPMEHHSNLVPWQMLAAEKQLELRFIPLTGSGELDLDELPKLFADGRVKLVAFAHVSNVLGTVNPAAEIARMAREQGAVTVLDASQSAPHLPVDVNALGVDFLACTSHKMLGPTGIGVLWGRRERLEAMPPFLGGGEMIRTVSLTRSTWNELPWKFEAGTMAIAEAVGLGAAVRYLEVLGMERVFAHDRELAAYAMARLAEIPGVRLLGPPAGRRGGVVAFTVEGVHPHDVATVLDRDGVCVRAGHHCTMPLHEHLGIPASVRASFHAYSLSEDVDALVAGLHEVRKVFGR